MLERRVFLTVTPSVTGAASVNEGSSYNLNLSATSSLGANSVTGWTINWNDGSAVQTLSGNPSSITHVYADGTNAYSIAASASDADGTVAAAPLAVTVNNVAPSMTLYPSGSLVEGSSFYMALWASDPGHDTITRWTVDFGDGSGVQTLGGGTSQSTTHTYPDNSNYTITATATDEDGTYTSTYVAAVANVPPSLYVSRQASTSEGAPFTLNLASADPGTDTITSWSITWGDGTVSSITGNPSSATHTYADGPNAYTISATATDEDGTWTAPTNLDSSFGGGRVTTDFGSNYDYGQAAAIQGDGKVIAAGYTYNATSGYNFALARYNTDGMLDGTFGTGGKVISDFGSNTSDQAAGIVLQADPNNPSGPPLSIYIAGTSAGKFALARYTPGGILDGTFGTGGKVTTLVGSTSATGQALAIQSDGKVILGGYDFVSGTSNDFALVRYNTDGTPDSTFGTSGKVSTDLGTSAGDTGYSLKVQSDGKILLVGSSGGKFALARYTSAGILDSTFGTGGKVTTQIGSYTYSNGYSVTLQSDGKIVVGGTDYSNSSNYDFALARYTTNGTLDSTFGTGGIVTTDMGGSGDTGHAVAVASDGKIFLAGSAIVYAGGSNNFAIAKYNTDGTLDSSFGIGGKIVTGMGVNAIGSGIVLRPDGRVVVVGSANGNVAVANYDFAAAAYHPTDAVTVNNVNPTLSISGAASVNEGSAYTLNLSSTDPGQDTISSWVVTWGDGTVSTVAGNPSSTTHTYADGPHAYTITATASDEDGGPYASNALPVTVNNVNPTLSISGATSVNEGSAYTLNLSSTDPGQDTISSWVVTWGDGTVSTVAGNPSSTTHTYADGPHAYTISATVSDEDGGPYASNAQTVTVNAVAAPSNLTASPTAGGQIVLSWNDNSSDEDGFCIEESGNCLPCRKHVELHPGN